ncbi:2-keto-3-deoxygalactonate kinase [Hoeflea marina]|uniref:2-keto-3-deoxygalactonate kinase n=1 Tax=Hoeflea marina TaxID=274592 RepID=A0A317PM89_9HYPH|nr:2-dehydro-3-deoxygalactonokinase [Hoeflea marina]PWW01633.1 2-keto-3-deoxygalactonate kinase [Hoeflea marina]
MSAAPAFVAVDWGTSAFRLWLMSADGAVIAERRSNEGLAAASAAGFASVLESHLAPLPGSDGLPVVICGMAGSRQGWIEAGYVEVPAELTSIASGGVRVPGTERNVTILPGMCVKSAREPDVMRGEETQLLGAMLESSGAERFCMPGTHSKWVQMRDGKVTGFQTYMTGELFSVICSASILKHSIPDGGSVDANEPEFLTGVRDGWLTPARFTHELFSIRAGQLLHDRLPTDNRARLSGLLVGVEFAGAGVGDDESVALVASGRMEQLYHAALVACGARVQTIDADTAVQRGLRQAWRILATETGGRLSA